MTELRIKNKNGSSRIKMEIIKMLKNKNIIIVLELVYQNYILKIMLQLLKYKYQYRITEYLIAHEKLNIIFSSMIL